MDIAVNTFFAGFGVLTGVGLYFNGSFGLWTRAMQPWHLPYAFFHVSYWILVLAGALQGW